MPLIDHLPGRTLNINNEEYLFFSGTSYLGIGHQHAFKAALIGAMSSYGTVYSASRNNNLQLEIYHKTEKYLADVNHAESSVTLSSGLLAGQLAIKCFPEHQFIYAPNVHPALWAESKIEMQFADYQDFCERINNVVEAQLKPIVICCNSIDPLKCLSYDFGWIKSLPGDKDITLIFDDSHAIGIAGFTDIQNINTAHGIGNYYKYKKIASAGVNIIVISSLAKAIGIPGGIIFGDTEFIEKVKKSPYFIGASPIVPAYLHAFMHTAVLYSDALELLKRNIALFISLNRKFLVYFRYLPEYPVFYAENEKLYEELLQRKIMISSFAYPNPNDKPLTRIVLSALHNEDDIKILSNNISAIFTK